MAINETESDPFGYFARSWYSPVFGLTRTLSPVPMNSGTLTVAPFSSFAGFCDAVFVAVFITGDVSTTSSVSEFGRRMPTGPDEAMLDARDRVECLAGDELRAARAETDDRDVPDLRCTRSCHELSVTTEPVAGSHRP